MSPSLQIEALLKTCNAKTHLHNTYKNAIAVLITHTHYMTTHRGLDWVGYWRRVCAQRSAKWLQRLQGSNDPIIRTPWMPFGSYVALKPSQCDRNWLKGPLSYTVLQTRAGLATSATSPQQCLRMSLIWSAVKQMPGFGSLRTCVSTRDWLWLRFVASIVSKPKLDWRGLSSDDHWFDRLGSSEIWAHR